MSRQVFAELWDVSHDKSGWFTAFGDALKDLTPEQAAWKPTPQRHSIWQIVNHVAFWREYMTAKQAGKPVPEGEERDRRSWEEPSKVSADAWKATLDRFNRARASFREHLLNEKAPLDEVGGHLLHDVYHVGQISYLRALQGLLPVS